MLAKAQGAQSGEASAPEPQAAPAPEPAPRPPTNAQPDAASRPVPQANPLAGQARAAAPRASVGPLPVGDGPVAAEAKEGGGGKRVHWSHVAPLSETPVRCPPAPAPRRVVPV